MATAASTSNSTPAPSISRPTPTTPAFNQPSTPAQLFYGARGRSGSIASSFAKQQAASREQNQSPTPPLPPIPPSVSLNSGVTNANSTPERGHGRSSSITSFARSSTFPSLTSPVRSTSTAGSPIRSTFGEPLPPIRAGESFSVHRPSSPSRSTIVPPPRNPSPLGGLSLALPPPTRGQNRAQGANTYSGGSTYSNHGGHSGHGHARSSSTVTEQIPLARLPSKQSREALIPIGPGGSSAVKNALGGDRGGGSPSFGAMLFSAGKRASLGFGGRDKDKSKDKDKEDEEKHVVIAVDPIPNHPAEQDKEKGWGDSLGGVRSPRESIVRFTRTRSRSSSLGSQTQARSSGGESSKQPRAAHAAHAAHADQTPRDNNPTEQVHRASPHVLIDNPRESNVTEHPRSSYPRHSESSRRRPVSYTSSGWQPDTAPIMRDPKGRVVRQHELIASESRWFCGGRLITGGGTRRVPVKERKAHPYAADKLGEDGEGDWAYSVGASGYAYEGGVLSATTNTLTPNTETKLGERKRTKRARFTLIPYPFVFSVVLVLGTAGAWMGTTCVWWWKHVSPGLAAAGAWLVLLAIVSMARTAFTDPGIVPRNLDPNPTRGDDGVPYARDLYVRGIPVRVKYCITCKTYRPLRSSHCRICDNCVDGCDHHCQWVNNCIGRRNYTTFITFLIACFLAILLMVVTSALHIYFQTLPEHGSKSFREALGGAGAGSAVVFLVCATVVWPVGTLLGYHIRLLALNITTIEQLRNDARASLEPGAADAPGPNAFSLGKWTRNAAWGACRPAGLSWVEGWKPVRADQRRLVDEDGVAV